MKNDQFAIIDPDDVILSLFNNDNNCRYIPEYRDSNNKRLPNKYDVNSINDENFLLAIQKKYNIVFDGSGKDFDWFVGNDGPITILQNYKYTVHICINFLDVKTAIVRAIARQSITGRETKSDYIEKVYSILDSAIPRYMKLKNVHIHVYDNTGEKTVKLIEIADGIITKLNNQDNLICKNQLLDKICECLKIGGSSKKPQKTSPKKRSKKKSKKKSKNKPKKKSKKEHQSKLNRFICEFYALMISSGYMI